MIYNHLGVLKKKLKNMKSKIIGIIPARYESKRFFGKMLHPILGKPLIQLTYENAKKSKILDDLYIATDDEKIKKIAESFNAKCIMTSSSCENGTARIIEALKKRKELQSSDIIVNIQGDHPSISQNTIEETVSVLINEPTATSSTAVTKINYEMAKSENVVKCVMDKNNNAMYFSRSVIPFSKDKKNTIYYYHIGIYVYRTKFLLSLENLDKSNLQKLEDLEQLKILEHSFKMKVAIVDDMPLGIDVIEDIKKVEKVICR